MATINPLEALSLAPRASAPILPPPPSAQLERQQPKGSQRIDLEPLYTNLKIVIGDDWPAYQNALTRFALGRMNQAELTETAYPLLSKDIQGFNIHNRLLCGILLNASRDQAPPEAGVAAWVAATNRPGLGTGPGGPGQGAGGKGGSSGLSGDDVAERRLKAEIMALMPRDRGRIKSIQENATTSPMAELIAFQSARQIRVPDHVPASAGGFNKTNWEMEIRKRYTGSLFGESLDFPDADSIASRMTPICYEEGLPNGSSASAPDFIQLAVEAVTKAILTNMFSRIRSNGPDYIKTGQYKRRLEREEAAWLRGEITKNKQGLLPVEVEARQKDRMLNLDDVKLSVDLRDPYLSKYPTLCHKFFTQYAPPPTHPDQSTALPDLSDLMIIDRPAVPTLTNGIRNRNATPPPLTSLPLSRQASASKPTAKKISFAPNGINHQRTSLMSSSQPNGISSSHSPSRRQSPFASTNTHNNHNQLSAPTSIPTTSSLSKLHSSLSHNISSSITTSLPYPRDQSILDAALTQHLLAMKHNHSANTSLRDPHALVAALTHPGNPLSAIPATYNDTQKPPSSTTAFAPITVNGNGGTGPTTNGNADAGPMDWETNDMGWGATKGASRRARRELGGVLDDVMG